MTSGNLNFKNWLELNPEEESQDALTTALREKVVSSKGLNGFDLDDRFFTGIGWQTTAL